MRSANPAYLKDIDQAAPGHRFNLYYAGWGDDKDWKKQTEIEINGKRLSANAYVLGKVSQLPKHSRDLLTALTARQKAEAHALTTPIFTYLAIASAPFATGLGNEHPLENGFSFLTPYGLPYLPGSGVKGVIRKAAKELLSGGWDDDTQGWSAEAIRALFGPGEEEDDDTRDSNPLQGALRFWDVFPTPPTSIKNDKALLCVEIMTPHHRDYYQDGTTPNTNKAPKPITFLAVAAEARFTFHVECNLARLDPELQARWCQLIEAAFTHAGKWLGFGAKTAVGYGRMKVDTAALESQRKDDEKQVAEQRRVKEEQTKQAHLDSLSPFERSIESVLADKPKDQSELKALFNALKKKHWQDEEARQIAQRLQAQMNANGQWREKSDKKKPEKDEPYQMTLFVKSVLSA